MTEDEHAELTRMDAAWINYTGEMPEHLYRRWCELQVKRRMSGEGSQS